ncbi:chromodomain-helicase-DNA-binding protein 1-like isoform X2 [Dysidea avara]|uniref:chromodomain-helicase-DNA-binding protein 1-like isoform X2 n=1 Tax=Dysidea avara TaxID=196820 RepID=UPI0033318D77
MERFISKKDKYLRSLPAAPAAITQSNLENWGLNNVTLRHYQLEGLNWLARRYGPSRGCIIGDEMGLGKTLQSISLMLFVLKGRKLTGPILVVCPLSVMNNWQEELLRFTPSLKVINMLGSKEEREEKRQAILEEEAADPFDVMLAHYDVVIRDISFLKKFQWQCLIVDEAHRLKNPSSVLHCSLLQLSVQFKLLLTGTPVQNNLNELYSLLSFVVPTTFNITSLDSFCDVFSNLQEDDEVTGGLHQLLQPFLLRRVKSEVLLDLPERSEVTLYTGMTSLQKKLYKSILMRDTSVFGEAGSRTSLMNVLMQLRKCCNHPYLFDGVEPEPFELGEHLVESSGKLLALDKLLEHARSCDHRVLIFSQMTRMLDIIQDYLGYRGYSYERLDGSVRGEERFLAVKNFTEDEDIFIFLLSTKAGGQGLNLSTADTVVFMDSDYNPQNDLQAAARAHRLGQTRPVKVIRLVNQHSVEEIILNRASSKMRLTSAVIAEGQFSHGTVGSGAGGLGSEKELQEILKFGLNNLLESTDSSASEQLDMESILGPTCGGRWVTTTTPATMATPSSDTPPEENMYIYEGEDYSKLCSDKDKKSFDELLAAQLVVTDTTPEEKVLRSRHHVIPVSASLVALPAARKRKQLTPEELEQRRKKREENRLKKLRLLEEEERQKMEERKQRRLEYWKRNGYTSLNVVVNSDSEEEDVLSDGDEDGQEAWSEEINYVMGDVTHPQNTGASDVIIVHCVDDSGRWGKGGLFDALSARSTQPQMCYEQAGKMKDLTLGDAHLIPIDDLQSREQGRDMLVLIVAQSRDKDGRLSGIKLTALSDGLRRVAVEAKKMKASVHLPRIGHSTVHFNWYGTERLIRKHLIMRRIPTYIYYFARHRTTAKSTDRPSVMRSHDPNMEVSQPLPDIFTSCVVHLYGFNEAEQRRLARYVVAYNGDVSSSVSNEVTHVVLSNMSDVDKVPTPNAGIHIVTSDWINDSLNKHHLQDVRKYQVTTPNNSL